MAEDDIVILDEETTVSGVREIQLKPSSTLAKKFAALEIKQAPAPVPEPPREIFYEYNGQPQKVYARDGAVFIWPVNDYPRLLAYNKYHYLDHDRTKLESERAAVAMMMGETKVFAPSQAEMDAFKKLLETHAVTVSPGKTLCVFVDGGVQTDMNCTSEFDGVMCITIGKDRVRWSDRQATFDEMDAVRTEKVDDVFDMISRLVERSTRGLRVKRKEEENHRLRIMALRHEEIFNYLSDVTPPPMAKEIHDLLLERMETCYTDDQAQLRFHNESIKELDQKIADAKGSLPRGRSGAALRKSYLEAKVLKDLLLFCDAWRDGNVMELELGFRKDLVLEGIRYGRPLICIRFCSDRRNGRDGTHVQRVTAKSMDLRAFMHPHLRGNESWCLGTYSPAVSAAFMSGNIPVVVSLLWQYLNEYNSASPLVSIDSCRSQMGAARPRDLVVRRK